MSLLVRLKYLFMYFRCVRVCVSQVLSLNSNRNGNDEDRTFHATDPSQQCSDTLFNRRKWVAFFQWTTDREKCTSTDKWKQKTICGNRNRSPRLRLFSFRVCFARKCKNINSVTSEWWRIWCDNFVLRSPFPVPLRRRSSSIFSPDFWPLSQTTSLRSTILRFPFSMRAIASQPAAWMATSYQTVENSLVWSSRINSCFFYRFFFFLHNLISLRVVSTFN